MNRKAKLLLALLGFFYMAFGLMLASLDWTSRWATDWIYRTRIITWILSFSPNDILYYNVAVASLQAALLTRAIPRLLHAILHFKVQRMTLSGPSFPTWKIKLSFDSFEWISGKNYVKIGSLDIEFEIYPDRPASPCISICKPQVRTNFDNEAHNLVENNVLSNDTKKVASQYREKFLIYIQRILLHRFFRHVELAVTDGIVEVSDMSHERQAHLKIMFHNISYGNSPESHLSISELWADITLLSSQQATFGCQTCFISFSNFRKRSQPYSNKAMNVVFGRQHMNFWLYFTRTCFHVGHRRSKEFEIVDSDAFYANSINIKLVNFLTGTQEKGLLEIKTEDPIYLKYEPSVAELVEIGFQYLAPYRSADVNHPANVVPMPPATQQTFPAALDIMIAVTLDKISVMLSNERKSRAWMYCKELKMTKSLSESTLVISSLGLLMGSDRELKKFAKLLEEDGNIKPDNENKCTTVQGINIKHEHSHEDCRRVFMKNATITYDVLNYLNQLHTEIMKLITKLIPLVPPVAQAPVPKYEVQVDIVTILYPLTNVGPTAKIVANEMEAVLHNTNIITLYQVAITIGYGPATKHKFLCLESRDNETGRRWTISTENKGPRELSFATLYKLVPKKMMKEYFESRKVGWGWNCFNTSNIE